jgi:hypothetical protein
MEIEGRLHVIEVEAVISIMQVTDSYIPEN